MRSASIACLRPISICWSASTCRAKASALDAADEVQLARLTPQHQSRLVNEPSFAAAKAQLNALANQLEGAKYDAVRAALRALANA